MLEPPSPSLLKLLATLRLCTPRELRRCRRYVRRLTRDLPAFDSIWIDALVQARRLTAFQAQCLEAGRGHMLQVGPCLLLERLGGSGTAETFLARRSGAEDLCVLKLTEVAPEQLRPLSERLKHFVASSADFRHPAVVLPQAVHVVEWPSPGERRIVTISRYVRGPHLAELVVRRGRFPISIVVEIGRQLLDGLAELEACGFVHGEISLTNVRITPSGQAVLVDGGLVSELRPHFTFHALRSADRYEGLAPERISAGLAPSSASDLYALGSLLWHLLAGRPPFAIGDPLAKIAAHQTQRIGDVREWVPDVPEWLAETLLSWTATNPAARPRSLREAASILGKPTRAGRRRIARFRGEFDRSTPRPPAAASRTRWPLTVAVIFVLTGAALSLLDQGARSFVLSLGRSRVPERSLTPLHEVRRENSARVIPPEGSTRATIDLPPPDRQGRIVLAPAGRYHAEELAGRGTLAVLGDAANPAEIVVGERSLSVWADHVQLRHVRVVRSTSAVDRAPPLLIAECRRLDVADCRFEQGELEVSNQRRAAPAIAWRLLEEAQPAATRIRLQNVVFSGRGPAVFVKSPPVQLAAENVLKIGLGDFVQVADPRSGAWDLRLVRVTLRDATSLLRFWESADGAKPGRLNLSATGCAIGLIAAEHAATSATGRPALIAWMSRELPRDWNSTISWQISGTLIGPDVDVIVQVDPQTGRRSVPDESRLEIDGLLVAPFEFSGPPSGEPQDSRLLPVNAPLPAGTQIGIDADALPVLDAAAR